MRFAGLLQGVSSAWTAHDTFEGQLVDVDYPTDVGSIGQAISMATTRS